MRPLPSYEEVAGQRSERITIEHARSIVRRALRDGKAFELPSRIPATRWEVHYQMNCLTPVVRHKFAREAYGRRAMQSMSIRAMYRCRQCEGCMHSKARLWGSRSCEEFRAWPTALMATFTLSPAEDALLDMRVAAKQPIGGISADEMFKLRAREFYGEVQAWLNRVRDAAFERNGGQRGTLRYLFVAEAHDSEKTSVLKRGRPHFHGLIYETKRGALIDGDALYARDQKCRHGEYFWKKYEKTPGNWAEGVFLLDESMLRSQWTLGHSTFEVCYSEQGAFYVCKYMSSDGRYKVNASELYGEPDRWLAKYGERYGLSIGGTDAPPSAERSEVSTSPTNPVEN